MGHWRHLYTHIIVFYILRVYLLGYIYNNNHVLYSTAVAAIQYIITSMYNVHYKYLTTPTQFFRFHLNRIRFCRDFEMFILYTYYIIYTILNIICVHIHISNVDYNIFILNSDRELKKNALSILIRITVTDQEYGIFFEILNLWSRIIVIYIYI